MNLEEQPLQVLGKGEEGLEGEWKRPCQTEKGLSVQQRAAGRDFGSGQLYSYIH